MFSCEQVLGFAAPDACSYVVTLFEESENLLVDFIQTALVR